MCIHMSGIDPEHCTNCIEMKEFNEAEAPEAETESEKDSGVLTPENI